MVYIVFAYFTFNTCGLFFWLFGLAELCVDTIYLTISYATGRFSKQEDGGFIKFNKPKKWVSFATILLSEIGMTLWAITFILECIDNLSYYTGPKANLYALISLNGLNVIATTIQLFLILRIWYGGMKIPREEGKFKNHFFKVY